jgi:hypothetical protein
VEFKVHRYDGRLLKGPIEVSIKIDGVRLHVESGVYRSRAGKPLYNLPKGLADGVYEIYRNNFKETIEVVRASISEREPIREDEVYRLDVLDDRLLFAGHSEGIDHNDITLYLDCVVAEGLEGLVVKEVETGKLWKAKKEHTEDVKVTAVIPGKGKYVGKMGALMTDMGKVGTGFTDEERQLYNTKDMIGQTIEVKCMEITEDGKFRLPRFIRLREDK